MWQALCSLLVFSRISSLNPNNSPPGYVVFIDESTESQMHTGQGRAGEARQSESSVRALRAQGCAQPRHGTFHVFPSMPRLWVVTSRSLSRAPVSSLLPSSTISRNTRCLQISGIWLHLRGLHHFSTPASLASLPIPDQRTSSSPPPITLCLSKDSASSPCKMRAVSPQWTEVGRKPR